MFDTHWNFKSLGALELFVNIAEGNPSSNIRQTSRVSQQPNTQQTFFSQYSNYEHPSSSNHESQPASTYEPPSSFNYVRETIDHKEGMAKGEYKVDLQARWCDCGKFQALHMPCSHVIAACSSFSHDYSSYIDPVFRNERVYAVYNRSFNPVHHQSYWPPYVGFVLCPNLSTRRPKKGRPNTTRIRTEMDEVSKKM
jgi:hypothetical protein